MSILDANYYEDLANQKRAEELKCVGDAINYVCPECHYGEDIVMYYCQLHDKDEGFEAEVARMPKEYQWKLLDILWGTDYDIFVPWFGKVLERIRYSTEDDWPMRFAREEADGLYEMYKEKWDKLGVL